MSNYLFSFESVTEGHPDKMCDLISDKILDEYIKKDKSARVALDVVIAANKVIVLGQVTSKISVNIEEIVRETIKEIGYDNSQTDIDYRNCEIEIILEKQSPDIAIGVNQGGAGDQGIMFGFACNETKECMPLGSIISNELSKRITEVRKKKILDYLKPDGKVQVTIEYEDDIPKRIDTIVISVQHKEGIDIEQIRKDIKKEVIEKVVLSKYVDSNTKYHINPTGRFIIGGPKADTGMTGRKIIVDTYNGYSKHGGGAFSGKDPTKVDRAAAYMLRHIAKNVVANGLARKCEIQIGYAIGVEEPVSLYIDTFGTETMPKDELLELIKERFDLTPKGVILYLNLNQPIYSKTTNYGHFGAKELPWEAIIKL